jgi:hypothetical protein
VSTEYEVWQDHRESGYLPLDTYRWETDIRIYESKSAGWDEEIASATWGFSLSVDTPR